ncbi:hypothetical protein EP7_005174 [Isosphaeraceae bacterium EP7]
MSIKLRTTFHMIAGLVILAGLPGCGGPTAAALSVDHAEEVKLQQVGEMLREYQISLGKPPKSIKQLVLNSGGSLGGFELVKSGDVVVNWGAALPDTKEEPGASPAQEVLAYGKSVPERGGPVLLLNRSVIRMTPEEFKAAPKASVAAASASATAPK